MRRRRTYRHVLCAGGNGGVWRHRGARDVHYRRRECGSGTVGHFFFHFFPWAIWMRLTNDESCTDRVFSVFCFFLFRCVLWISWSADLRAGIWGHLHSNVDPVFPTLPPTNVPISSHVPVIITEISSHEAPTRSSTYALFYPFFFGTILGLWPLASGEGDAEMRGRNKSLDIFFLKWSSTMKTSWSFEKAKLLFFYPPHFDQFSSVKDRLLSASGSGVWRELGRFCRFVLLSSLPRV